MNPPLKIRGNNFNSTTFQQCYLLLFLMNQPTKHKIYDNTLYAVYIYFLKKSKTNHMPLRASIIADRKPAEY
jgi:hypothetical protein